MDPDELVRQCPEIYHMAELRSWPSIQRHGLLSTAAILDLFGIQGQERIKLESEWRPRSIRLNHPTHGSAVIRDQHPMRDRELRGLLTGSLDPRQWYQFINRKTFFWADRQRLIWMLEAYWDRPHCVLTVDTRTLLDRHLDEIWLTDQNSGSIRSGKMRGLDTFKKVGDFRSRWVAELAVDYKVADVAEFTTSVDEWQAGKNPHRIWQRRSRS